MTLGPCARPELDVLLASASDEGERVDAERLRPAPRHIVLTHGSNGGDGALEIGARCGAWCLTGRGPYGRQLTAAAPPPRPPA